MTQEHTTKLSAELHDVYQGDNSVTAHINVCEDGEWIGDFFARFTYKAIGGERAYTADWSDVSVGNGIYVDEEPPFWPVEEIADVLDEKYELQNFRAINSGPQDI